MGIMTADQVADFLLLKAREKNKFLTNLEVQKLVYYAQAWHLAYYDKPLYDDPILAWQHGPVVHSVYKRFKGFKREAITMALDSPPVPPREVSNLLCEVIDGYSKYTAWQLRNQTHDESPWILARKGVDKKKNSNNNISHESMIACYRDRYCKSTIGISEVKVGDVHLRFKKTLLLDPIFDKSTNFIALQHEPLGIDVFAINQEELMEDLDEQIVMLWEEYALEEDKNLSSDAKKLKRSLLAALEEMGDGKK